MFVHVINSLDRGGAEKQLLEFVRRSSLPNEVIELGNDAAPDRLRQLRAELARRDPDAVMAWLERSQISVAAVAPRGTPLVANVCGLPRRTGLHRLGILAAFSRYTAFVTNSQAVREATRRYAKPLNLHPFDVVPNGVEEAPRLAIRRRIEGPLRVGFIGRADPAKGVDVLAEALSRLSPREVRATLVGRGIRETLPGLPDGIVAEVIDGSEDPWEAVGDLDLLVVSSKSEGSPNVVIEAFARGVPVIATAVGGTTELLADRRGTLVPSRDPEALANAMRDVRGHWEAALEASDRARRYAKAAHSWPAVVAGYEDVLIRTRRV